MEREIVSPEQLRSAALSDLNKKSFEMDGVVYYASKDKAQSIVEHQRYKQDCRKRALDLAHGERDYDGTPQTGLAQRFPTTKSPEKILESADKYYNWLISIPEK